MEISAPRARYLLVFVMAGLTLLLVAARIVLPGPNRDWLFPVTALVFLGVSVVLLIRVPENSVSWVLGAITVGVLLSGGSTLVPNSRVGDIVNGLALFVVLLPALGVYLPLWFPTGSPPTPRWRWVSRMAAAGVTAFLVGSLWSVFLGEDVTGEVNCVSTATCTAVGGLSLVLLAIVLSIVALIVRWVRATGVERLQLRWLLPAFLAFGIGAIAEFGGFQGSIVSRIMLPLGLLLVPLAIGAAVLRYRLYEIDRIISRTLAYSLVVGLLALIFFGGVTLLTALLPAESQLTIAGSTLVVAAAFNPLRKRIQSWVERRFNRARYDRERVAGEFAASLRERLDQDDVVSGLMGVVASTMEPVSMGVWLRRTDP